MSIELSQITKPVYICRSANGMPNTYFAIVPGQKQAWRAEDPIKKWYLSKSYDAETLWDNWKVGHDLSWWDEVPFYEISRIGLPAIPGYAEGDGVTPLEPYLFWVSLRGGKDRGLYCILRSDNTVWYFEIGRDTHWQKSNCYPTADSLTKAFNNPPPDECEPLSVCYAHQLLGLNVPPIPPMEVILDTPPVCEPSEPTKSAFEKPKWVEPPGDGCQWDKICDDAPPAGLASKWTPAAGFTPFRYTFDTTKISKQIFDAGRLSELKKTAGWLRTNLENLEELIGRLEKEQ